MTAHQDTTPAFTALRRIAMSQSSYLRSARCIALKPIVAATFLGMLASPHAFAFNSGSTGADGALATTVGTVEVQVPESGVLNYTSVNIAAGTTVKFKRNSLNTPVYMLVSGNVTIAGYVDIRGQDAKHVGTYADGNQADDGIPGAGAAGGYDGGRGGRDDINMRPEIIRGGSGLGPGGGKGGIEGPDGCSGTRHYKYQGLGAAYATQGSDGQYRVSCNQSAIGPDAARPYGSALLQPLVGGSGGGGGRGGANYAGSGGGGGGGALLIAASGTLNIASTGAIDATGGDSGGAAGTNAGGKGGGGSGGAIRLIATSITGNGNIYAAGGCTNVNNTRRQECLDLTWFYQYGGAAGRIRLEGESITFSGGSQPTYVADTPGPIFLASLPSLRIAFVAGTAVPANPTGNADVTLPANVTNPVTVGLETTNVPTGNTVLVKLIPAYGNTTEVLSPAIAGTAASGTTSVQVNLPQGPSVLQATTTYTVVVAMGEALSRFAQNERVEKVQLIATMGSEGRAKLITISGKEYMVPLSVLQMVGFTG
jgi:hypothetical protein